ncbi:MAG: DUF389 domain-containing protein [Pseudomonadota bacterium]
MSDHSIETELRKAPASRRSILVFEGPRRRDYWRRFSFMLALSVVIATAGLYRSSGAVVIAAMLVAPLMTPILGIAAALVMGWARRAGILLLVVLAAAAASAGLAYLMMLVSGAPRGLGVPPELAARTNPGMEDLLVALAAGAAGAYVQLNRAEVSLVPGAAIGVALVPPLAASGIFAYFGHFVSAFDALILFSTNLSAIVLAALLVYLSADMRPTWTQRGHAARFGAGFLVTTALVVGVAVHLANETWRRFETSRLEERAWREVVDWAGDSSVEIARISLIDRARNRTPRLELWLIIDTPFASADRIAAPSDLLPESLSGPALRERLRSVLGDRFNVALRFNLRYSGLVNLGTGFEAEAPQPFEGVEETVPAETGGPASD